MGVPVRLRLCGFVALSLAVAACSETAVEPAPETPEIEGPLLSVAPDGGTAAGDYVLAVSRGRFAAISGAIADAGGTVVRSHPQVGILIASGLSDDVAASLSSAAGVRAMAADVMIDHPADLTGMTVRAAPAGHDPSQAFFYQAGLQWDMQIIEADAAWAAGATAAGITVAIVDTGIDPLHQDLAGLVDASRSVAFVPNANPSLPPWGDDHLHGTHVAGTVASNGIGTAGVAPHATLMAVKVCGAFFGCPFSAILSGIIHATDNDAHVINMSLGGLIGKSFPGGGRLNAILNLVMNYASSNGVVVVSAAGNSGLDLDHLGRDFGAGSFISTPCESGNGMCVSATDVFDDPTGYTNYGTSAISLAAPGGDGSSPSARVIAPCSSGSVLLPHCQTDTDWYVQIFGTSMATPHVSGAAALVAASGVSSPGKIKTTLQRTADDLGKKGTDPFYGKGRLNVRKATGN